MAPESTAIKEHAEGEEVAHARGPGGWVRCSLQPGRPQQHWDTEKQTHEFACNQKSYKVCFSHHQNTNKNRVLWHLCAL